MKLHLGCGQNYLEGYVNIDYPPSEHTIQKTSPADIHADLTTLQYPPGSIAEVRSHHVFEHFPRPVALALLFRWHRWLATGGRLRIETPDAQACFVQLVNPMLTYVEKQQVMRHLFGSHEAHWAVHHDGWYEQKLKRTLQCIGFEDLRFTKTRYLLTRNIEVNAVKSARALNDQEYEAAARELLLESTIQRGQPKSFPLDETEANMLEVWLGLWRAAFHAERS